MVDGLDVARSPVDQVTLAEAAVRIDVPVASLYAWRARGDLHPCGIVRNPRPIAVFELDEIRSVAATRQRRRRSA